MASLVVFGIALVFFLVLFLAMRAVNEPEHECLRVSGFLGLVIFVALSVAAMLGSSGAMPEYATAREASTYLGLTPGKAYPVEIGPSTDTNIESDSTTYAHIDSHPSSSVSITFHTGNHSYDFRVPLAKINRVNTDGPPTITFSLDDARSDGYGAAQICDWGWSGIYYMKQCHDAAIQPSQELKQGGLRPIIQQHLVSATIKVPHDAGAQWLGN